MLYIEFLKWTRDIFKVEFKQNCRQPLKLVVIVIITQCMVDWIFRILFVMFPELHSRSKSSGFVIPGLECRHYWLNTHWKRFLLYTVASRIANFEFVDLIYSVSSYVSMFQRVSGVECLRCFVLLQTRLLWCFTGEFGCEFLFFWLGLLCACVLLIFSSAVEKLLQTKSP